MSLSILKDAAQGSVSHIVVDASSGAPITLPSGQFASDATYLQQGDDLVLIGPDGTTVTVDGYFLLDHPPDLLTPEGGHITPALVHSFTPPEAAGQYAQAGQLTQAGEPIGQVQDVTGHAFAVHADGTRVQLAAGDAVFQGDVVETGDGGAVNLIFLDKTTFALGADARLALDEMVYNPATHAGNSSFSILKGVFVFVSGEIAHADNTKMTVTTPVATIGIRGTTVAGDVRPAGEESHFTVIHGEISVSTQGGSVVMGDPNATTTITSYQAPPAAPVVFTPQQLESNYGSVKSVSHDFFSGQHTDAGHLNGLSPAAGGNGEAGGDGGAGGAAPHAVVPDQTSTVGGFGGAVDPLPNASIDPLQVTDAAAGLGDTTAIVTTIAPVLVDNTVTSLVLGEGEGAAIVTNDFSLSDAPVTFVGSDANDLIVGSSFNDSFNGSGGNDIIDGGAGNDIINGGAGNDILTGNGGDDTVNGGPGNDTLIAGSGAGNDHYDGGSGIDTLVYSSTSHGITVDLAAGTASGNEIGSDTFVNIEHFIGGSGNDLFLGSSGQFFVDGGGGQDTLSFAAFSTGLTFDVSAGTVFGDGLVTGGLTDGTPVTVPAPVDFIETSGGATWFDLGNLGGLLGVNDATSPGDTGTSDHYDDALAVRVGGEAYTAPSTFEQVGNHFIANSQHLAGLDVVVDYKFDDTLPVVRQVVALTNNTGSEISTDVSWINNSGNDSTFQVIGSSSGDLQAGLNDSYIVTSDTPTAFSTGGNETDTWVMYGPGDPSVTTSSLALTENEPNFGGFGNEGVTAGYNVSVGAGQTIYLMFFNAIGGVNQDEINFATIFDNTTNSSFQSLISDIPSDQLAATVNWDGLSGTGGIFTNVETLIGGSGDDLFQHVDGSVVVQAGAGNDTFTASSTNFNGVDGGTGFDTVVMQGSGHTFDLTNLNSSQLTGVEAVDITGSGNNTLKLNAAAVLAATNGTNAETNTDHTIIVDGNSGDTVNLQNDFAQTGTVTINQDSYTVYHSTTTAAQVVVNDHVNVTGSVPLA